MVDWKTTKYLFAVLMMILAFISLASVQRAFGDKSFIPKLDTAIGNTPIPAFPATEVHITRNPFARNEINWEYVEYVGND